MSYRAAAIFPEPTWRLCHPVNIYVYKNGVPAEKPQLVHIPMEKKKNMSTVLEAIGARMKLPVGYPIALYNMDGTRVCKTYELEMYNNYVVVTNLEKTFKCVDYGKLRGPLVVIGHHSKHVNTLNFQNKKFDLFCRRKMARRPLHELAANADVPDGLSPSEVTTGGRPCGVLCHKIQPSRTKPTQVCSDEIMCVEGAAMDQEPDYCRQPIVHSNGQISPLCQGEELEALARQVRQEAEGRGSTTGSQSAHLVDLIQRYKDVGSDIFRMFQDRINQVTDADSNVSSRWNIPTQLDPETQQKLKDEWLRLTNAPCDFTFDEFGNFLYSSGCRIGPPPEGGEGGNSSPKRGGSLTGGQPGDIGDSIVEIMKAGKLPTDIRLSFLQMLEKQQSTEKQARSSKDSRSKNQNDEGALSDDEQTKMLEAMKKSILESATLQQERLSNSSNKPSGPGGDDPIDEAQFGKPPSDHEINEIIRHMSNSLMGGAATKSSFEASLPTIPESNGESERNSEVVSPVENEDEGSMRRGSVKSNKSNNDDDQQQVFKLTIENSNRNPFKNDSIGRLPFSGRKTESLVGKLSSDRINSLIAQNPFRKCFLFGDKNGVRDDLFKTGRQLPPEDFPKRRGNKVAFAEEDVNNNNVNINEQQPPSVTFQIPASNRSSDVLPFSSNEGGGGNARRKLCPGFLTQINELVHRLDNSKATSPPPPTAPPQKSMDVSERFSSSTFTIERRRDCDLVDTEDERPQRPPPPPPRRMDRREVGCGSNTLFQVAKTRNVCAQIGHSNLSGRNNEGGTQTVESSKTKMVRDEEVEPAGIYEGYQETFKSRETANYSSDSSGSENSFPLPYNRNSYARRRRKHGRNKEYRHYEERRESRVEGSQQSPRYLNPPNQEMGYSGAHASESPRSNPNAGTFTRTINISTGRPPPPDHLPANQQQQQQQRQQQQQPNPQQPVFQRFIVNHNHPSANVIVRNPALPSTSQQTPPPVPPRQSSQLPPNTGQFFVQTSPTTGAPLSLIARHQNQAQQQPMILRMQNYGNNGGGVMFPPGVQLVRNMGSRIIQAPSGQIGQPILLASQQQPQQIQSRFAVTQPTTSAAGGPPNMVGLTRMQMPINNGMVPVMLQSPNGSILQTSTGQPVQFVQSGTINGGSGTVLRPLQSGNFVLVNNSNNNQTLQTNKYISMSPYSLTQAHHQNLPKNK